VWIGEKIKMSDLKVGLALAYSYFSFIPINIKEYRDNSAIRKYLLLFIPLVGFSLGLIAIAIFFILNNFFHPIFSAIIVSMIYMKAYGFLHLEAICDVADGYFASFSNKDIHKIMKEPTVGAMGIISVTLFLILKVSSIVYLFYLDKVWLLLIAVTLSRVSIYYVLYFFEFHPSSSMAKYLKSDLDTKLLIFATAIYIGILSFIFDSYVVVLFVTMLILSYFIINHIKNRFGFINGDVIGYNIEMIELLLLVALIAL
jgi:adenosylcobinamide-GDP ribazoletransferase